MHVGLGGLQLRDHAPAVDEGLHILSGYKAWTTAEIPDPTHPPLARYFLTLPLALMGAEPQPAHAVPPGSRHDEVQHFLVHNQRPVSWVLGVTRAMAVLLSLLVVLAAWRWSRRLWGEGGGLVTLALLA